MSLTPQYGWDLPDVGADEDAWGDLLRTLWTDLDDILGSGTTKIVSGATFADATDTTKEADFDFSGLTTSTSRTYTFPDYNATLATIAGTETLTNKTLTTPTIGTSATLTGAAQDWTLALDGNDLVFQYNGVDVFKLTTAGAIIAKDDITAFGAP